MTDKTRFLKPLTLETNQEETWVALRQFYSKNHAAIEKSQSLDVGQGQFQEELDQVLEASQVLLDGLAALANVHPVIGVAVFAFHGIIKLDITRRENNRKVLAVKLQMQSMMSAMFQLCELKHVHILDEPQKAVQRAQLQALVKTIADEIKQCGSDLNYYSDRKFVSKLIKAKIYERLFAEHVETFAVRRSELQSVITAYISTGVDAANIAIGHVGEKVELVDKKIDSLLAIFQRLDTSSEREILKFIDDNGGAEKCISKDESLKALLTQSGNSLDWEPLTDTRKALRAELSEDLNKTLSLNLNRFERLLVIQNNNLERLTDQIERQSFGLVDQSMKLDRLLTTSISILEEGKLIKKTVVPNSPIRLKDPEFQRIWEGMGLANRRSVKAKQFVLTLRDYLIAADRSIAATPELRSAFLPDSEPTSSSLLSISVPNHPAVGAVWDSSESDSWVLKHIDAAHVQPIIEAMDVDGSGFISVQEANKFALSRPKGMKLLHWFAYWAAGWHYNIADYRSRIYKVMQQLHMISEHVLASNRKLFASYLDDWDYFRIEGILRHITGPASNVPRDAKLVEVAEAISVMQEERLRKNLEELSYVLRSPADVALVIGNGPLETWLLPLICVLLARHLEIFSIARSRPLLSAEFLDHCLSIESIITVYEERMRQLRDIFRPVGRDTEIHFKNFAYGMFVDAYKWTGSRIAGGNTLLSFVDEASVDSPDDDSGILLSDPATDGATSDTSVLVYGPGKGSVFLNLAELDLQSISDSVTHEDASSDVPSGIEGRWVGSFVDDNMPPFECIICPVVDGKFQAKGRDYADPLEFSGLFDEQTAGVSITLYDSGYLPVRLKGTYDSSRDTIRGWWAMIMDYPGGIAEDDDPPEDPQKTFNMTRHTVSSFRFRHLLDLGKDGLEVSIARRRWTFAIQAVLFEVQGKLGSWQFMRRRVVERNDWIELSIRNFPPDGMRVTRGFLDDTELAHWQELRSIIHPSTLAIYHSIRRYLEDRQFYDAGSVACDVCRQHIMFRQYMCITCIEEDYSNWVNFCVGSNCSEIQSTFSTNDFVHSSSHTLLRATERIYTYELPTVISRVQFLSEDIKKMFKEPTAPTNRRRVADVKSSKTSPTIDDVKASHPACSCCSKPLALPCWVCAVCVPTVYFCIQCERGFDAPLKPRGAIPYGHSSVHHLLRVSDNIEAKVIKQRSQDKLIDDTEARINNRLRELQLHQEAHTEERISALEEKLDNRMTVLESKVDSLILLMQQMLRASERGKTLES